MGRIPAVRPNRSNGLRNVRPILNNSKIRISGEASRRDQSKTNYPWPISPPTNHGKTAISLPLDACLREAASAKAGGRIEVAAGSESLPPGHEPLLGRRLARRGVAMIWSPSPPPSPPWGEGRCEKSQDSQSGQRDVGKTVGRLPFSGLMMRIENHLRWIT